MDKYISNKLYIREDFLSDPGDVPMVRVVDESGFVAAIITPEEFGQRYTFVPAEA